MNYQNSIPSTKRFFMLDSRVVDFASKDYYLLSLKTLRLFSKAPVDFYVVVRKDDKYTLMLALRKGEDVEKFTFRLGEFSSDDKINILLNKKDWLEFVNSYVCTLSNLLRYQKDNPEQNYKLIYEGMYYASRVLFSFTDDSRTIMACLRALEVGSEYLLQAFNRYSISAFMDILSNKDSLFIHSVNTAVISIIITFNTYLPGKLSDRFLFRLVLASLVHDIGKKFIPASILNKHGKLSDKERAVVMQHSLKGALLLAQKKFFHLDVCKSVLQHHENEDGSGYPYGLREKEITEMAKIIHVADVFSALTMDRPYRSAFSPQTAMDIMLDERDKYEQNYLLALDEVLTRRRYKKVHQEEKT